jgi:hypothetical protein
MTILFTAPYSARTYLHGPSFLESDLLTFHDRAADCKEALLSFLDNRFFTRLECAEKTTLPFMSQMVTTRTDGLRSRSLFVAF